MNNRKGFTLIELLVVVLIIGILAAMALPQYFKAVERSRMSEAEGLLRSIGEAQQRKYLQINKFAEKYTGLDVAPKGATGAEFHTKDTNGNGFKVSLTGTTWTTGIAKAEREANGVVSATAANNKLQYRYDLSRYYASTATECKGYDDNGKALCADFCGVDELTGDTCCNQDVTTEGGEGESPTVSRQGSCAAPAAVGTGS